MRERRLPAREAAVELLVARTTAELLVREEARHARRVDLADLDRVVRLGEAVRLPGREQLVVTEADLVRPALLEVDRRETEHRLVREAGPGRALARVRPDAVQVLLHARVRPELALLELLAAAQAGAPVRVER